MADLTREFALTFVDALAHHQVRHAVVAPGSRSTPIALALFEHPSITVHVRIDERSASFLALGIAKATGHPVPVLCTSGTAAAEFHPAVLEADQGGVPLLVLTADRPPELHGIGANQTINQVGLYGDAVRWFCNVTAAEPGQQSQWSDTADRATRIARLEAGPVHLNLELREPLVSAEEFLPDPHTNPAESMATADRTGLDRLIHRLGGLSRVVVVAGDGADSTAIEHLAQRAGWPVIAEPHSGQRGGATALRAVDALLQDPSLDEANRPELVIVFGRVGLSRALVEWLSRTPHVVIDGRGRHLDVANSAEAVHRIDPELLSELEPPTEPDRQWLAAWQEASTAAGNAIDEVLDETDALSEPRVARDLIGLLPDDAALVVSSSMPIRDLDIVMRNRRLPILANRGVSGIDGFVSTAQGIAIGRSDRLTYALTGDLSFLHDVNGLMPGPSQRPDITYVVINNNGGGIFSLLPQGKQVEAKAFEQLFGTPHGIDIAALATAYQCKHQLVTTISELVEAVRWEPGVRIIEVRTDRNENAALHLRMREAAADAVAELMAGHDDGHG